MNKIFNHIALICIVLIIPKVLFSQESIFNGFESTLKKADKYYENQSYPEAILRYEQLIKKNKKAPDIFLKLANSFYYVNDMSQAGKWYAAYNQTTNSLSDEELLRYASALQANGKIDEALKLLKKYQLSNDSTIELSKRIWQLQHIDILYEDSMQFEVTPISLNTSYDESAPIILGGTLVFIRNDPSFQAVQRIDGFTNKPFFRWLSTKRSNQGENGEFNFQYSSPQQFVEEIHSKFHKGSISFTAHGDSMVFTRSANLSDVSMGYSNQLFFAKKESGKWVEYDEFPFNSLKYSLSHPFLTDNNKTLYFSSDMPGGYGGMDLYISHYVNGKWTTPENLGNGINTSGNEGHPFIQNNVLYFSSNGHPGLGGLDIFSTKLSEPNPEIVNFGYPINTSSDDFGFVLDSTGFCGYLTSNRDTDNDNIYEVILYKRTFPIVIQGIIKYRSNDHANPVSEMHLLTNANLELIDKITNMTVLNTHTDDKGNFSIKIPYKSQFLLKVEEEGFGTAIVSMEIPKNHLDYLIHEIVIIKD